MTNNDLLITFNDTIANVTITDNDLYISIYGPLSSYSFSWTAAFQTPTTIYVNMNITDEITDNGEKVYIDFPYTNNLLSIYSQRKTNPDTSLNGKLNKAQANTSSGSTVFDSKFWTPLKKSPPNFYHTEN